MLAACAVASLFVNAYSLGPRVSTSLGLIEGYRQAINISPDANIKFPLQVDTFLGIPYALPPINDLRFRRPRPVVPWQGIRQTKAFGSDCIQVVEDVSGSEDCLYLNVFSPVVEQDAQPLPVMIWIHGGGFYWSSAAVYDMTALAANRKVVVVSMNYRLGIHGFFASNATLAEEGTTGNWGMLDQREAMRWVQKEIDNFRGDPSRVTLFGESAGAFSVQWHLVSPASFGLYHKAIVQSGGAESNWFFQNLEDATRFYDWSAKTVARCDSPNNSKCMRSVPGQRLVVRKTDRNGNRAPDWASPLFAASAFGPVIDGKELFGLPGQQVLAGVFANVPLIIGVNKDEGTLFATQVKKTVRNSRGESATFPPTRWIDGENILKYFFPSVPKGRALLEKYMLDRKPVYPAAFNNNRVVSATSLITHFLRDTQFHCPSLDFAAAVTRKFPDTPVYFYDFVFDPFPTKLSNKPLGFVGSDFADMKTSGPGLALNSFHAAELPFSMLLFPNSHLEIANLGVRNPWALFTSQPFTVPGDRLHQMADVMSCLWTNFAVCDSPGCQDCGGMVVSQDDVGLDGQVLDLPDGPPITRLPHWERFDHTAPAFLRLDVSQGTGGQMVSFPQNLADAQQNKFEMVDLETCAVLRDVVYEFADLSVTAFSERTGTPEPLHHVFESHSHKLPLFKTTRKP